MKPRIMQIVCKHCGLGKEEHHEFVLAMPDGCQCDPYEWCGRVYEVCESFVGDGETCERCEHDMSCHK